MRTQHAGQKHIHDTSSLQRSSMQRSSTQKQHNSTYIKKNRGAGSRKNRGPFQRTKVSHVETTYQDMRQRRHTQKQNKGTEPLSAPTKHQERMITCSYQHTNRRLEERNLTMTRKIELRLYPF